jgi:hypothetical protein
LSRQARRQMTVRKFERRHPDVSLVVLENRTGLCVIAREASGRRCGSVIARRCGPVGSRNRLLWDLSGAVQAIRRREVARAQGYRDAQTGEMKPLQMHHIQFRSHGGTYEQSNLAGVSAETHRKRHEG